MMGWYKMHAGAALDAKWIVIGHLAGVAPGVVAAMAWAMLDHASKADVRGDVSGFDPRSFALWAGFDIEQCNAVQRCMLQERFIVDGRIANWDRYQGGRGSGTAMTSTERSRKHRENKKKTSSQESRENNATDATLHATATPKIREERERDKVSLSSPPLPPSGCGRRSSPQVRGADDPQGQRGGGAGSPEPTRSTALCGRAAGVIGEAAARTWLADAGIEADALVVASPFAARMIEERCDAPSLRRALGVARIVGRAATGSASGIGEVRHVAA